jgi:large subunit ribosomal protein L17
MVSTRKFHRKRGQRIAFKKGLAANLIQKERIQTTVARAKEVRPIVERYITIAKKVDKKDKLSQLRLLFAKLPKSAAEKVFYDIAPRYKDRRGGYLRIVKTAKFRKRDGAPTAIIEFV